MTIKAPRVGKYKRKLAVVEKEVLFNQPKRATWQKISKNLSER
ncbi:hypothetical protein [Sporosarcina sp. JAI121]|nr:hypothetical protein [Sporosarcina sp. JAI121]NYF24757.1 hypothetical protein [Sporosarcina sp. JAI121]